ncbi:hypothetical protein CK203_110587 [Vitis vinifera]|uniref:Uncharacterized protein n=1 Tax=Vitis vinifera TaxID=29760 RepID=A0A438CPM6_VITVI|nr:hypothetical protein CK203_110587 [Vitis vinifera]
MVETLGIGQRSSLSHWAYRTSFRTSIGATPYSLVYGMEAVLPVEIEMRSLRVTLEQHISEAEWAYDPRGKFRPSWSGPYVIRDLTREGTAWLTDLDGNQFTELVNVDQLKKFYAFYHLYSLRFCFPLCDDDALSSQSYQSGLSHLAHMVLRYLTLRTQGLRLLIEYGMLTGLHYFGGYRGSHIVFPFSLLASGMLPSWHVGFGSLYMYAGIPFRLAMLWTSKFELGHNSFLSPLVTFVTLSYRGIPHSFHLLVVFDFWLLRVICWQSLDVILGHTPLLSCSVVPRHRAQFDRPNSTIFWYSPGAFRYLPEPFSGTCPETSPVLVRTLLRYSPEFYPFPVLARNRLRYSPGAFLVLARSFSGTCPNLLRYLPGTFSGTRPNFPRFRYSRRILPVSGTRPDPSPVLARILPVFGNRPDSTIFRIFCNRSAGWQPVQPVRPVHQVDQLASGSAGSAGSLSQLSKLKTEGVSWPCKFKRSNEGRGSHADEGDFGAEGEGIQEAQMLRGDEYKSLSSSSSYAFSPSSSSFLPFDMKIVLLGCGQ